MNNLYSNIPADLSDEVVETLLQDEALRIKRIVSHGHASAKDFWHDQPQHEWVLLLQGEAKLRFEDDADPLSMKPGDFVNIPAGRRHRVEWTTPAEPTIWLAIRYGAETR
jgi:cupin 2 domain-containing protein